MHVQEFYKSSIIQIMHLIWALPIDNYDYDYD